MHAQGDADGEGWMTMDSDATVWVSTTCECLVGLVFLNASVTKLRDASGFVDSVHRLAPAQVAQWSRPVAGVVVMLEALVPILLLTQLTVRVGLALAASLLIAFTLAIVDALRRGAGVRCRCFGAARLPLGRRHVARNAVLLLTVVAAGVTAPSALLSVGGTQLALAIAVSLPGVIVLVALDHIIDLFAPSVLARVKES